MGVFHILIKSCLCWEGGRTRITAAERVFSGSLVIVTMSCGIRGFVYLCICLFVYLCVFVKTCVFVLSGSLVIVMMSCGIIRVS